MGVVAPGERKHHLIIQQRASKRLTPWLESLDLKLSGLFMYRQVFNIQKF